MADVQILTPSDPPPVAIRPGGPGSPFVIVCDHGGKTFPRTLGTLGLSKLDRTRHIAWDIGAAAVARSLGRMLDACVIEQAYSRLIIDCNRPLHAPTSIVEVSDNTVIPGNAGLTQEDKNARARAIFEPYHRGIANELDRRRAWAQPTVLIALHSFTPVFMSVARPWHIGTLYRDKQFAGIVLQLLRGYELTVGDNEPYQVSDATDYSIPVHGEQRGLPHTGLEIRQDLIAEEAGQQRFAGLLADVLTTAYEQLDRQGPLAAPDAD